MLGFLPREDYDGMMRSMRVMFYHSTEPYHLHYHPLEAVRAGMPLVFMGGGLLDRLGGVGLPGRAATIRQARAKVERILDGDERFIDKVRSSQARLLRAMDPSRLEPAWRAGVDRIKAKVSQARKRRAYVAGAARTPRIAVLLAHEYRGGTLRGAKLVAEALACGARHAGQAAEIVFGHVDNTLALRGGRLRRFAGQHCAPSVSLGQSRSGGSRTGCDLCRYLAGCVRPLCVP